MVHTAVRRGGGSLALVLALACGTSEAPPADGGPSRAEPAVKKGEDAKAPEAKAPEAEAPEPAEPAEPDHEPDDYLVWFRSGEGWTTRWIDAADPDSPRVAERRALVLSDGRRLWSVERHDAEVDVVGCECLEADEEGPACTPTGRMTNLGLRAVELGGGGTVEVRPPDTEMVIGGDAYASLDVVGGVGSRLIQRWSYSGYFCGAHGSVAGGDEVFDLASGRKVDEPFVPIQPELPAALRREAGEEIHQLLSECEGPDGPSLTEVVDERMALTGATVTLRGGEPQITWAFEADVYYACSPDYAAHGDATSGLDPAAASLGLAGPLPQGLRAELARIDRAFAVGWSPIDLSGAERAEAIARFSVVPERVWPPSSMSSRPLPPTAPAAPSEARPAATAEAKTKVSEGRRQTRAGEHAAAISTYDAAIALDPGLARAWSERGYAKLLAGDLVGARADLEHALPLDDGQVYQASIHYNLGLVAEREGDAAEAKAAFERSLELRDNETVRKALARVAE